MSRLAYYASSVAGKETWFETPEGYRIYKDVPICRTGSQRYLGRELKSNSGYNPLWGLKDGELYKVFRPIEEIANPATTASFEAKSVLDQHPPDKALVDALDEYDGVSKGHVQNVRVGPLLTDGAFAGETPLIADLHVKNPELNLKIEGGVREVSCGYRFVLSKDEVGRLIMTQIRGNHVAVVPRGRAGPEIAIGDAAVIGVANSSIYEFSVGDALTTLESDPIRKAIARSRDSVAIKSYNALTENMRKVRDGVKDGAINDQTNNRKGEIMPKSDPKSTTVSTGAAKDAWRYPQYATNGEHEIFEADKPGPWWEGTAASWPHSSLRTTSVEQLRQQAAAQQQEDKFDELPTLEDLGGDWLAEKPIEGVADALPNPMSFFAGRSYSEGRRLYNEARVSRGLPPIAEGRR